MSSRPEGAPSLSTKKWKTHTCICIYIYAFLDVVPRVILRASRTFLRRSAAMMLLHAKKATIRFLPRRDNRKRNDEPPKMKVASSDPLSGGFFSPIPAHRGSQQEAYFPVAIKVTLSMSGQYYFRFSVEGKVPHDGDEYIFPRKQRKRRHLSGDGGP